MQLLHTGASPRATVIGPMAEVVANSLQHLSGADVAAMATYLQALPPTAAEGDMKVKPSASTMTAGGTIYDQHCVECHGADGRGLAPAYPPLAGNRAVTLHESANVARIILQGGFAPGTNANPRPYGMPPFAHVLNDDEVAQVMTYVRASWGNRGNEVTAAQVNRYRGATLE